MPAAKVEIAGSYRPEPEDADAIGNVDAADRITLTLHLKSRSAAEPEPGSAADLARLSRPTTRRALAAERARAYALIAARIGRFADAYGLTVGEIDLPGRRVVLQGGAQRVADTFDASMRLYDDGRRRFRARVGTLSVPAEIAPWTRAVLGFDERPQVRCLQSSAGEGEGAGLFPTEIAALYGIPLNRDVSAQCVGIIALGGGHLASDLQMALGMMQRPTPIVVDQSVGGAVNTFGGGTAADQEIALDLQVAASLLPQARIVVYFAGNTTRTLADALHQAVLDDVNKPQALSISWGSAEKFWTNAAREAVQAALADAVRLRVSIVVASGDDLATGGSTDGKAHVWFPASSPYVLGCGGTAATVAGAEIATETVWNDGVSGTGGGISDTFPVPAYQTGVALPASVNDGGKAPGRARCGRHGGAQPGLPDHRRRQAHGEGRHQRCHAAMGRAHRHGQCRARRAHGAHQPVPLCQSCAVSSRHRRQQPDRRRRLRRRTRMERLHRARGTEGRRNHRGR